MPAQSGGGRAPLATLALLGAVVLAAPVTPAGARCRSAADRAAFLVNARRALSCRQHRLVGGRSVPCAPVAPPRCARGAVARAAALTFGSATPPGAIRGKGLGPQLRCQAALAHASRRFLARRLRERLHGRRRERGSRAVFAHVLERCSVRVAQSRSGVTLPSVGGVCAGVVGAPGIALDAAALAGCLRPALERILDDVAPEPLRPNVVLITTDDQRWDTLAVMPTVLALASQGVRFTNAFTSTPLCAPSRSALLTGRYAHHTGVLDNNGPHGGAKVFDDGSTLATWLHGAGYRTGLFGKYLNEFFRIAPHVPPGWDVWHAFVEDTPLYYGYTLDQDGALVRHGSAPSDYSTDLLGATAAEFVRANAERPFFVYYAPFAPHAPATPAARHAGRFAGVAPWRPPSYMEADVSLKPFWEQFMVQFWTPDVTLYVDTLRIAQLEALQAVDEAVATLRDTLGDLGLDDDTVVVFTSDNGFTWGEHWWQGKEIASEESIRVPLVVHYPGRFAAGTQDGLVQLVDLAPTLAELADAVAPDGRNGRSLTALLDGRGTWRDRVLTEYWERALVPIGTYAAVRTATEKLVQYDADDFRELYDLAVDPHELANRAGDPSAAGLASSLAMTLEALRQE